MTGTTPAHYEEDAGDSRGSVWTDGRFGAGLSDDMALVERAASASPDSPDQSVLLSSPHNVEYGVPRGLRWWARRYHLDHRAGGV